MRTFATGATRDTETDKLELAWAAGLFDGEGSVIKEHKEGRRRKDGTQRSYPRLYVGNTDQELLERFQTALQAGKIHGPYGRFGRYGQAIKPMYHWTASHRQGRKAAALLYPLLASHNRQRVAAAFSEEEADG